MHGPVANSKEKFIVGMVHLPPLPGTPYYNNDSLNAIISTAIGSAKALEDGGAHGCLIQTVDRVYRTDDVSDPARTAALALIVDAVVRTTSTSFAVGLQVMRNAIMTSLGIAKVCGANFVRANTLVGLTLSEHGPVIANPLAVIEYRKKISAHNIGLHAEIASKHYHWAEADKPVADIAKHAKLLGADAVCVGCKGEQELLDLVASVRKAQSDIPVMLSGFTNHENASRLLAQADGAYVGSSLEPEGWGTSIDVERVKAYMAIVNGLA